MTPSERCSFAISGVLGAHVIAIGGLPGFTLTVMVAGMLLVVN